MCFGGGGSKAPPPPQPPTRFEYLPAGRTQQQQAATATNQPTSGTASYGSELGSGPTTRPEIVAQQVHGGM